MNMQVKIPTIKTNCVVTIDDLSQEWFASHKSYGPRSLNGIEVEAHGSHPHIPRIGGKLTKLALIIAKEFVPQPPGCFYVGHKNGDIYDCRIENLKWVPHAAPFRDQTFVEHERGVRRVGDKATVWLKGGGEMIAITTDTMPEARAVRDFYLREFDCSYR